MKASKAKSGARAMLSASILLAAGFACAGCSDKADTAHQQQAAPGEVTTAQQQAQGDALIQSGQALIDRGTRMKPGEVDAKGMTREQILAKGRQYVSIGESMKAGEAPRGSVIEDDPTRQR